MVKKISAGAADTATDTATDTTSGKAGRAESKAKASSPLGGAAAMLQGLQGLQGLFDKQLAGAVKDSAQQIWLAGMGAFSKAQAEGGKAFESLVKEGLNLQKKTQNIAEEKISEVTGRMTAMAGSVTAKAGENWDKLESIFEARTAKAMNKMGVPTAKDLDTLAQRVDELAAAVAKLGKAVGGAAVKPVAKPVIKPAVKAAAKPAAKVATQAAAKAAAVAPAAPERSRKKPAA